MEIVISASLSGGDDYPPGKPDRIEQLPDWRRIMHMPDGVRLTVPAQPTYVMRYQSRGLPDDYYEVRVAISGRLIMGGKFFEAWNYDKDERRHYLFKKTLLLIPLDSGKTMTGEKLCVELGGTID